MSKSGQEMLKMMNFCELKMARVNWCFCILELLRKLLDVSFLSK